MPSGQSHTTWFPELITRLKQSWKNDLNIPEQFGLVKDLNEKLSQIRMEHNVKPPMIWCPNCEARHEGRLTGVTIMYHSLKRFDICSDQEFKDLMKTWKVYSQENGVDINGNQKENKSTKAQHCI